MKQDDNPSPAEATRQAARLPLWANPRIGLVVLLIALIALFTTLRPAFLNTQLTLVPMQSDISVYAVVGLAQLAVLSLGHMNMAVGRMAAMSAFAAGLLHDRLDAPLVVCLLGGLATGALLGALAGLIIARTGVNSFVVTLALDFALIGLVSLLYATFTDGVAFGGLPAGMSALRTDTFADYCAGDVCGPEIPLLAPIALVAALGVGLLFRWSRIGREVLMTGANAKAAQLSGIPVNLRVIQAHALSGLLAGLAGFLLSANNGSFSAGVGDGFLLPSFLAPVLGGTLLVGGAVSVLGTVLGTAITQVIYKGLNLLQFQVDELKLYIGLVLLAALSLDRLRHVLAERRGVPA
ncbi:sugar ABC transporter permease [Catellatospora sp. IY07-71]|uniref:ABC transporter permease n=1 Tax=Catellatospora sp. IY07-71 TaxID=2728827 RepID=UPI001BB43C11|nr:ABC transporter permease [Catellatospora sp. IY07-71]BCJ73891.1 sugar ABC transporter permease [Catellatospora sp. IY07-71]